jgi:hypothetical protein
MNVAEFLSWDAPAGSRWQLVDGEPQAMAPASRTHGVIQNELGRLLGNHLAAQAPGCSVITNAGTIPRVRADANFRIPDLAVTCSDYQEEEYDVSEPVLMVEILSPTNKTETWANVWAYTTIPTVREILVLTASAFGQNSCDGIQRASGRNAPRSSKMVRWSWQALASALSFCRCIGAPGWRGHHAEPGESAGGRQHIVAGQADTSRALILKVRCSRRPTPPVPLWQGYFVDTAWRAVVAYRAPHRRQPTAELHSLW